MEKIVISVDEIAQTACSPDEARSLSAKLPPPIPRWARACLAPLVLVLPIMCVVTVLLRVAMRGLPPRSRYAWVSFFSTLLVISGILTSIACVIAFTLTPTPMASVVSQGLSELDSRTVFPVLPSEQDLTAEAVSENLKPLVTVITPARQIGRGSWAGR